MEVSWKCLNVLRMLLYSRYGVFLGVYLVSLKFDNCKRFNGKLMFRKN